MPIKNTKHQGILNARNLKQVQNAKANVTKSKRLSRDDLYNALELSYHLEGFTHQIDIYPDLVVIVGLKEMLLELNKVLETKCGKEVCIGYDTTFLLGDFYVSPLVFTHEIFANPPTVPVAFLIHERKYQCVHERFFQKLIEKVPNLKKSQLNS